MRLLRIRQWMLVGTLTFLVVPTLVYQITAAFDRHVLQPFAQQPTQQDAALDTTLREVASSSARWHDPQWQSSFKNTLNTLGVGGLILDPSGTEIVRTGFIGSVNRPSRQAVVVEEARQLGTVDLFVPERPAPLATAAAAIALVLTLLNAGWQMGRTVVRPLEAMSRAARRVAVGDLHFELPQSRVREIAEVRAAFEAMGDGLKASIMRQAELEEERRFFIGAIAHDLRTPLFVLRGYLVGLERGLATSPEQAARYVAVCQQKADQLDRLVSDLFAYTKAEYLEQTLRREQLELGPLMERTVADLRLRARAKGVKVESVGPNSSCVIEGDAHLLERALENLLDNALRHTPTEGRIQVRWHRDLDWVVFTVGDTGPGITPADMPHLFDPLYRGEPSRNRQTGGAGLGLAIARRVLLTHGGDLVAANRATGGAEFTGWLPLAQHQLVTR
jgi:signal transduction histidine kinase